MPVGLEALFYLVGGQHLRVDEVVETHVLEEAFVLRQQVFVVIDSRERSLGAQGVGDEARRHVLRLVRSDGDEQVAVLDANLPQVVYRGWITYFGEHVIVGAQVAQPLLEFVQETDFHVLTAQQFSQVCTYFSSTRNNDSHKPSLSNFNKWYSSLVEPCSTNRSLTPRRMMRGV